jgi:hypothetical protein
MPEFHQAAWMLRLTAAAVAEPIPQSLNSAGDVSMGSRRNPGPHF